jgi:flagellar hook-basal body complex protein FliE
VISAISAALGPLDPSEWSIGGIAGGDPSGAAGGVGAIGGSGSGSGSGSFSGALSSALDSLQATQDTAASASQALATGTATDPTQAVTAVENASLAMDLASQIRTKLVDSVNTIFQTQV